MSPFAVVDIETTGLDRHTDRILEIAVIELDEHLDEESRWHSLINPERPSGAVHIHGLDDAALVGAPTFDEVADRLVHLLDGRMLVAHNAAFEREFLNREFSLAGRDVSITADSCVCTMDQSRIYLPPGSHSLREVAHRLGIDVPAHHRATNDAETCARLLRAFVNRESLGNRFADSAINRRGENVLPAPWKRAHPWLRSETAILG